MTDYDTDNKEPSETCGVGRPSKFETVRDELISAAADGHAKCECAEIVGISEPTLHRYLNNRQSFREEFEAAYCWSRSEWAKENDIGAPSGSEHPLWNGGKRGDRGPNWIQQRRKCLERDGHECVSCGMTDAEHREWHSQSYGLHVHHIIPRREFDIDDSEQNHLDNLVTLCFQCHELYEGTYFNPVTRA